MDVNNIEIKTCKSHLNDVLESLINKATVNPPDLSTFEKQREIAKRKSFEKSGVGRKYFAKTLNDFDAYNDELKQHLLVVNQYISSVKKKQNRSLWLCGNSGTGKTFLGSMIIQECGGKFVRSYELEDMIEEAKSFNSKTSKIEIIKSFAGEPLLVIDEIGRCKSQNEISILFRLLNERYENELPTVLLTNLSKSSLKEYLGQAIYDRFTETCKCLEFNSNSYRPKERVL